ncbi:MAG: chromosome segregation protein SMC, partial [Gammaproteobacteria bacterium]|nr:chromosome segregation protein SMC [Gammaproteobacteria bacterium]
NLIREQIAEMQLQQEDVQQTQQLNTDKIQQTRYQIQQQQQQLELLRSQRNKLEGRRASLDALQQAALGKGSKTIQAWLKHQGFAENPRLGEQLSVTAGWEKAVETVLGQALQAVCVESLAPAAALLGSLEQGSVMLFASERQTGDKSIENNRLLSKIQSELDIAALFQDIYTADDLSQALALLPNLSSQASVITQDGIWLSSSWARVWRDNDEHTGILQRNQEIEQLEQELNANELTLVDKESALAQSRQDLQGFEQVKDDEQKQLTQLSSRLAMLQADARVRQNRLEQQQRRREQINRESGELQSSQKEAQQQLQDIRTHWQAALASMENDAQTRQGLHAARDELQAKLDQVKARYREDNDNFHRLYVKQQSLTAELRTKQQSLARSEQQVQHMRERCAYLEQSLLEAAAPMDELKAQLEEALEQRLVADDKLQEAKRALDSLDYQIKQQEQQRHQANNQANILRGQLEQLRLTYQAEEVRQQSILEQTEALNVVIADVVNGLSPQANEAEWERALEDVQRRIQRLGAINLAAIEEFATESERKQYLDAQHKDLTEALALLDEAIQKIDKETRTKFRETFEIVNQAFQLLFPKVFGGGNAYLELTSDNLLETGVTVMARPPGKKNSTIHLLSGGEKALTAIALVFSIFQLNPAPFCMLDEVDAPLDDANVGRYCHLIKEMAKTVQFIFISHNKLAMEMADYLTGVTMKEPGVSRLVTVNMEEALALVEE